MADVATVLGQFGLGPTKGDQEAQPQQPQQPQVDPAKAAVDAVLSGVTSPQKAQADTAQPQPPAAQPPATLGAKAEGGGNNAADASPNTAAAPAAEPASPWDAVLDGPKEQTFTEDENKVFKTRFGKDAQAFVAEYASLQEEMKSVKAAASEYESFKKAWESAPIEIRNAFDKAVAGEQWRDYLAKTPSFDWAQGAEKQDKVRLIDHYIPGSLTQEEKEAIAGNDADDSLKARMGSLFSTASKLFEAERQGHLNQISSREAELSKQKAETASSVDASFAYVRERYPALAPELTDDLKADMLSFKAPFDAVMAKDGLRYSPEAAFRLIVAKNLDKVLARVSERARAQGRNEGVIEASQTVPATARVAAAAAPAPPVATGDGDPVMNLVQQVNQKVRQSQGKDPFANKQTP